jgi:branched-chain amino acid aminotransferase
MIDQADRGFMLGDGIFETLLVTSRVALWRDDHLERMAKAAKRLGLPFDSGEFANVMNNALREIDGEPHVMRLTLSRGVTARGLAMESEKPTLLVTCNSFDAASIGRPVSLITSSLRRNPASISDRFKTLSYINNVMAAREAKARGADDALMLTIDGMVACTSVANIFIVQGQKLVTPAESEGILPGVMRKFLIGHGAQLGFSVEARAIELDELHAADHVFITNSLRLLNPVRALDGEELRHGDANEFLNAMFAAVKSQSGFELRETV